MAKSKINLVVLSIVLVIIVGVISYKVLEHFQILECSTINNCRSCSNAFGCVWCIRTKKCISDLSANMLCAGSSRVASPLGCESGSLVDSSGANINSPLFGGSCSANNNCDSCLKSPDCFWCNNLKICAGSVELYRKCKDDTTIYNSLYQCSSATTSTPSDTSTPFNPADTVIPITGLSRNTDGSLTLSSLQIIFDSFAGKGKPIQDTQSKNDALNQINKEMTFYKNNYKTSINTYIDNSIDYVSDPKSLNDAKQIDQQIQDLKDISRFVNNYNVGRRRIDVASDFSNEFVGTNEYASPYAEPFVDTYTAHLDYNNTKQQYLGAKAQIQTFYFINLVALGTLFYFMNIS